MFRTWSLGAPNLAQSVLETMQIEVELGQLYCTNEFCSSPTAHLSGYALRNDLSRIEVNFRKKGVPVAGVRLVVYRRSLLSSTLKLQIAASEQTSRRALWPCFRYHGSHFPSGCTAQRDPLNVQGSPAGHSIWKTVLLPTTYAAETDGPNASEGVHPACRGYFDRKACSFLLGSFDRTERPFLVSRRRNQEC